MKNPRGPGINKIFIHVKVYNEDIILFYLNPLSDVILIIENKDELSMSQYIKNPFSKFFPIFFYKLVLFSVNETICYQLSCNFALHNSIII